MKPVEVFSSKKRILIVEDSKYQAANLVHLLEAEDYSVISANNGVTALYKMQEYFPDLIITDVWMPEMNGYDFCRTIKDDKEFAHTPIILLTSLSQSKDIVSGLNAGADYYLTKPYGPNLLLSMVAAILAGKNNVTSQRIETFEVRSGGDVQTISTGIRQVANFLFSTYENLLEHNQQLTETKRQLKSLNDNLEVKIREKTLSLEQEAMGRERAHAALKEVLSQTVAALARTVEMRDPYTAGHQMRVGELAFRIGQQLGFSEGELQGIKVMGMLHDIGKIVVPAEILSKPSKLKPYEFLLIKAHSQAGYDVLKDIDFPWPVAQAVLQHHERLNGSGYPLQLKGRQIAIEARILAVADVIESMSSHRPYRPALGLNAAVEEVVTNKNVLYDPHVVEALLEALTDQIVYPESRTVESA
jgi:putative two-component system response regulator